MNTQLNNYKDYNLAIECMSFFRDLAREAKQEIIRLREEGNREEYKYKISQYVHLCKRAQQEQEIMEALT